MQKYNHPDLQDRHKIKALLDAGHNQSTIADLIGVHRSTISRELFRNVAKTDGPANGYCPQRAQQLTAIAIAIKVIWHRKRPSADELLSNSF